MSEEKVTLRALGEGTRTEYRYEEPQPQLLERIPNPAIDRSINAASATLAIRIDVPEFTCLCPVTAQPDWARIVIRYQPDGWCVESKALKLYLGSFRNAGVFHEAVITRICNELVELLDPHWMVVEGRFTPRGGIPFWPVSVYRRPSGDDDRERAPEGDYDTLAPLTERLDRAGGREEII